MYKEIVLHRIHCLLVVYWLTIAIDVESVVIPVLFDAHCFLSFVMFYLEILNLA
jgi:hypothetical protein